MAKHSNAEEARQGLIDSVKGKAKEIAGAVTSNDSLTAEGQFQQAAAKERRAASSAEAVADAEAQQARADATQARRGAADERGSVRARTDAVEHAVRVEQAAHERAAEQNGRRVEAAAKARADADVQRDVRDSIGHERADVGAAIADVADAVTDHQSAVRDAADAKAESLRLRQQADRIADADDKH